jgi:hypothetical protein
MTVPHQIFTHIHESISAISACVNKGTSLINLNANFDLEKELAAGDNGAAETVKA